MTGFEGLELPACFLWLAAYIPIAGVTLAMLMWDEK